MSLKALRIIRKKISNLELKEQRMRKKLGSPNIIIETDIIRDIVEFSATCERDTYLDKIDKERKNPWIKISELMNYLNNKYNIKFTTVYIKMLLNKLYGETISDWEDYSWKMVKKVRFNNRPEDGYYASFSFVTAWQKYYPSIHRGT